MATWGITSEQNSGSAVVSRWRAVGGAFSTSGQQLDSVHFWVDTADLDDDIRVAVYSGGDVATDDPSGASLLEDLGAYTPSATGLVTINSVTNPAIPVDDLWIFLKGSATSCAVDRGTGQSIGDITGAMNLDGRTDEDPATAYPDPCPTDSWGSAANSFSAYITHSAAASGPAPPAVSVTLSG